MAIRPADHGIFASSGGAVAAGAVYFAGGATTPWALLDTITKFSFLDDTRTVLTATLSIPSYDSGGAGNAGVAGYNMGGYGLLTAVNKLDFTAETVSTLVATLSAAISSFAGMSNNAVAAYTTGG